MRVLFLSNLYPPYVIGGYESLCLEVANGLAERGHEIVVLTSTYGIGQEITENNLHRILALESDLQFYKMRDAWLYPLKKRRNLDHLRRLVAMEKPDIVFIWGMWNISKSLAQEAEKLLGWRVVYYLANPWPIEPNMHQAFWDMPATSSARNLVKRMLRIPARFLLRSEWEQVPLRFEHAPCCSIAQRDQLIAAGIPLKDASVIYEGVNLKPYLAQAERRNYNAEEESLSLLFVGILAEHKGVHTTIEALNQLSAEDRKRVSLTILGSGHRQYEERLHNLVLQFQLSDLVSFHAPIPRSELPDFLGKFDVLLLPSVWPEPLARIMQEGLASGMVVVGSATGGTAETICHGENGLLFSAGDAVGLAQQIQSLLGNPLLRRALAEEGCRTAIERFDLKNMVHEIENYLEKVDETDGTN